ncbi:MAG: DNA primase [Phycisphaerae bacterium]|nr:DNA primase [Phycisphaerae bacterium]
MTSASREAATRRIRDSVDIVDVIGSYVVLRQAGANLKGLCPFHEEKTPSFNVHPAKQIFKCFGCGAGGDVFNFIQLREKVSFLEARAILADRAGISLDDDRHGDNQGPGKVDIARANQWAAGLFRRQLLSPAGEAARAYVEKRQIKPEMAEAFGLGYALDSFDGILQAARQAAHGEELLAAAGLVRAGGPRGCYDTFRNRLMFPIADTTDRIIGFGGRTLGDDPAKYLNTPETILFEKGRGLFGLNRAKDAIGRTGRAIVVEGYTDCMMAHQYGFEEVVATLGTAFTTEQAKLLRRYTDVVILVFDSDEAGQRAADRAISVSLCERLDVRLAHVPTGKDPCDFLLASGADAFARLLIDARPALEFKWLQVVGRYHQSETGPGQRRAVEEFIEQVAAWLREGAVDNIQRGIGLDQVGKLLSLSPGEVNRLVAAAQQRLRRPAGKEAVQASETGLAAPSGARQAILRQLIEVLLNEPEFVGQVGETLEAEVITDPVLATIAKEVLAWCREGQKSESWRLDELIGRFESPQFGQVVTDLQTAGERRGNYATTVGGALARLAELAETAKTISAGMEARRPDDREAETRALMAAHVGNRARRRFHPLSHGPGPG